MKRIKLMNMKTKRTCLQIACTILLIAVFSSSILAQKEYRFLYHKNWETINNKKPKDQKKWQEFELFAHMYARYAVPEEKTLPIVFNVLETNTSRKISQEAVDAQLQILNDAFAGVYEEKEHFYRDRMAGDSKIRFCHGTPSGNKVEINYKQISLPFSVQNLIQITDKKTGIEGAKKDEYINIWVTDLPDEMGGFALLPDVDDALDGIYIDPDFFGVNPAKKEYSQGKTLVHLMGQYLGLYPLWTNLECQGDGVEDTPTHNAPNYSCYGYSHVSMCPGNEEEMIGNFMDAGLDECSFMFTKGQVARMNANLSERGYRQNLKIGKKMCEKLLIEEPLEDRSKLEANLEIIPNPNDGKAEIRFSLLNNEEVYIAIFNMAGALIQKTIVPNIGEKNGHLMIDISAFPNGQYVVELRSPSTQISKQFFKF